MEGIVGVRGIEDHGVVETLDFFAVVRYCTAACVEEVETGFVQFHIDCLPGQYGPG